MALAITAMACNGTAIDTTAASTCGNGTQETLELCDDGNTQPGDGCSPVCRLEQGYVCDATNDAAMPCIPCMRQCDKAECGSDGCGRECGTCDPGESCNDKAECEEEALASNPDETLTSGSGSETGDGTDDSETTTEEDTSLCSFECQHNQIGDGVCQGSCYVEACSYDQNEEGVSDCTCDDLNLNEDCSGTCFDNEYLSYSNDNFCDDGENSWLNFLCLAWGNDNGACLPDFQNPEDPWVDTSSQQWPRCEADVNQEYQDCNATCFNDEDCIGLSGSTTVCTAWIGDGYCDDGSFGYNFLCNGWLNDAGDCD